MYILYIRIFEGIGTGLLRLMTGENMPRIFMDLCIIFLMCLLKFRLGSNVTPRYLVWLGQSMRWPLNEIFSAWCVECLLKSTATVFWVLISIRHLSNHSISVSTCLCNYLIVRLWFQFFDRRSVSSANKL